MELCIGVEFLLGRCMATAPNSRDQAEWPPHPDRLFMALVAALHSAENDDSERAALLWLEQQEPPSLLCTPAFQRSVLTHYVPVNDTSLPRIKNPATVSSKVRDAALELLPEYRSKQARTFPVAVPESNTLYYVWPQEAPEHIRIGLERLCARVTSLGHSSSLIWSWVGEPVREGRLELKPQKVGARFRVPHKGRLSALEENFTLGRRPSKGKWCAYSQAEDEEEQTPIGTTFDPALLVFEIVSRKRYSLRSTALLTDTLRKALISRCPEPVPSWLSGHEPDGTPLQQAHAAFVPLPHIGRRYADGKIMGLGLALPRGLSSETDLDTVLQLFDENGELQRLKLVMGEAGELELEFHSSGFLPTSLNPKTWTTASREWGTATPVVLDRHLRTKVPRGGSPGKRAEAELKRDQEIGLQVQAACERIGLPKPKVEILPVCPFVGGPSVWDFPHLPAAKGRRRWMTHARLTFPYEVSGPVLLGSGRYRGYGFCRPIRELGEEATNES